MRKLIALLLLFFALSAATSALFSALTVSAATGERHFPETGHNLKDRFLSYWEQNGGLAQYGYPLTEEIAEVSQTDGKIYTVQYFERAVFEHHPENQVPFDVLLSLLGSIEYKSKYPAAGAPGQQASTVNLRVFAQTGFTIGGKFREYWESHGGVSQQGYPISNEFQEVSLLDGKTYTVQYFERAVFEYHPENQAPADVLLSQLGTLRLRSRSNPPVSPTTSTVEPRLLANDVAGPVVGAGRYLFWVDTHKAEQPLIGYDVVQGTQFTVTNQLGNKFALATDGDMLVWAQSEETDVVYGFSLASRQQSVVLPATAQQEIGGLSIADGVLYYRSQRGLFAHELSSGTESLITERGTNPVAGNDVVLWTEETQSGGGKIRVSEVSLHLRKLDGTVLDAVIANGIGRLSGYRVSGDYVVWSFMPPEPDQRTYLYQISSGQRQVLGAGFTINPLLQGNIVVWSLEPSSQAGGASGWGIQSYNIDNGTTTTLLVPQDRSARAQALLSNAMVAYTIQQPDRTTALYLLVLDTR